MKLYESFNEFINEGIQFGKKGIAAKIKASLEYAEEQMEAGEVWYDKIVAKLEKMKPSNIRYDKHMGDFARQYSPKRDDYDLFNPNYAKSLAKEIAKVVAKYKSKEVEQSSTPAAAGWSGTMRSTVSGDIRPRVNFNNGSTSYIIGVTIGSGIDERTQDKIMQELYLLFFVFEEWNSNDGGIAFDYDHGSNYTTIGLSNRRLGFSKGFASSLLDMMTELNEDFISENVQEVQASEISTKAAKSLLTLAQKQNDDKYQGSYTVDKGNKQLRFDTVDALLSMVKAREEGMYGGPAYGVNITGKQELEIFGDNGDEIVGKLNTKSLSAAMASIVGAFKKSQKKHKG